MMRAKEFVLGTA